MKDALVSASLHDGIGVTDFNESAQSTSSNNLSEHCQSCQQDDTQQRKNITVKEMYLFFRNTAIWHWGKVNDDASVVSSRSLIHVTQLCWRMYTKVRIVEP